jgi:hypothetical protein
MWNRRYVIRYFDYKFVKKKENGQRLVFLSRSSNNNVIQKTTQGSFSSRVLRVGNPKQCWGKRGVLGERKNPLLSRGVFSSLKKTVYFL